MAIQTQFSVVNTADLSSLDVRVVIQDYQVAIAAWTPYLGGSANIIIDVNLEPLGPTYLALTGPDSLVDEGAAPDGNSLSVPVATSQLLSGASSSPVVAIDTQLDSVALTDGHDWLNPISPPPAGSQDLVSVLEHEFITGFAFIGYRSETAPFSYTADAETPFDQHTIVTDQQPYFIGTFAEQVWGGPVELAVSAIFRFGSWTNESDPLDADLMGPYTGGDGTQASPSVLDLAVLEDCGVPLSPLATDMVAAAGLSREITGTEASTTAALGVANSIAAGETTLAGYADQLLSATGHGLLEALTPVEQIAAIYVGYFDRAPDAAGFQYWEGQFANALASGQGVDQSLTQIADAFTPQAETQALYPFLSNGSTSTGNVVGTETLVDSVYSNLFGRTINSATDPGGQYWVQQLLNGKVALGSVILAIANGAEGNDALTLLNRVAAGAYFEAATASVGIGISVGSFPTSLDALVHSVVANTGSTSASLASAEASITTSVPSYQGIGIATPAVSTVGIAADTAHAGALGL